MFLCEYIQKLHQNRGMELNWELIKFFIGQQQKRKISLWVVLDAVLLFQRHLGEPVQGLSEYDQTKQMV